MSDLLEDDSIAAMSHARAVAVGYSMRDMLTDLQEVRAILRDISNAGVLDSTNGGRVDFARTLAMRMHIELSHMVMETLT